MRSAADFVDGFRRFWAAPSLDGLPALLAPDVKLVQPLAPVMRGLDEVRRNFGAIFAWLPDIRGEVDRWSGEGNVVFIEFRLRATIGGRPFECDNASSPYAFKVRALPYDPFFSSGRMHWRN